MTRSNPRPETDPKPTDLLLRPIERDHCYLAYLAERRRQQFPQELR